ncbi:M23 family metallopeptidase [Pollutibacter soli]|uniref:M23 family metallopeptidase n=1 Tax=Pollutibacter soli TaxID=3034157 RepID=UPI0030132B08
MRLATLLFFSFSFFVSRSQTVYPKGYFRYPLDIAPKLNANFGEMRPNHFHMGLDLSTERRENLPIYSAADGYIARIKIEPGGFGNAIYINHPNGFTTLYAHMNDFMPELQAFLKQIQYARESWDTDTTFISTRFPVKKGQFIGYSGNTGGSQGPHVHFEIRETNNEKCVNPLLFGFNIPDNVAPDLRLLAVYDRNQSIYEQYPQQFSLKKVAGFYQPSGVITVSSDRFFIALQATDRMSGVPNANGIYSIKVFENEVERGGFAIEKVGYEETRYLNAHIDYRIKTAGGPYLQQTFPLPGDKLGIYYNDQHEILLTDTLVHQFRLEVRDAYGNLSEAMFRIKRSSIPKNVLPKTGQLMKANEMNIFENDQVQLVIPEKGLYDSIYFRYGTSPSTAQLAYSVTQQLHQPSTPNQEYFTLRLKADKSIPYHLRDKLIVLRQYGSSQSVAKAFWELGWYRSKFRDFGNFQLVADDLPPLITTPGLVEGANLSKATRIVVGVKDNYNMINSFRAELDGKWLMFSQRGNTFTYKFDEYCGSGSHELKISVRDEAGNLSEKIIHFTR